MEVSLRHTGHLSIFWIVLMESKNTPKIPTLNGWERVERWFHPSKKICHWLVSLTNSKALILGGCYYFFQGRTVRTFSQQSRKKKKKKTGRAMKSNQEAITRRKIINEKERPGKISKAPPAKIMFNRSAMDKISFKWCFVDEIGIHSYITEQLCKNDCIHCIVPWKYSILKLPVY